MGIIPDMPPNKIDINLKSELTLENKQLRRLRLMTFIETLIILDITKVQSNTSFIIH